MVANENEALSVRSVALFLFLVGEDSRGEGMIPIQVHPLLSMGIYFAVATLVITVWCALAKDEYDVMAAVFVGTTWPFWVVLMVAFSPAIIGIVLAGTWKRLRKRR